jgi:lipoprotein-anchoring transpeptidase ErfK/SrfK
VLKVTSIDARPNYRYNPDYKFKGVKSREPSRSGPAPTTLPALTGSDSHLKDTAFMARRTPRRSASRKSHGCVRLTNWDVDRLAKLVKKGTEVAFIEREAANKK